jgi:predicted regulator of Ras-like GTPase activity (Roadblock/LC7/MglB family)
MLNTKTSLNIQIKSEVSEKIAEVFCKNHEIMMINLSTTDGFHLEHYTNELVDIEADKIAAIASTLCALSSSSATQIMKQEFNITTIENDTGNILFVSTKYLDLQCVLTLAAKSEMLLAQARFFTLNLAKIISNISDEL